MVFVSRLQNLRAMSDILQTKLYNGITLRVINLCPYVGHRFRGRADDQHLPQTRRSTDPQPLTVLMAHRVWYFVVPATSEFAHGMWMTTPLCVPWYAGSLN
jgi:hypothetical protein